VRSCLCLCVFAFYDKATAHTLFAHIRPASRPCPRRAPAGRPCNKVVLPVLGTQLVLLALPLQQQLVLVRAPRQVRVLDAPHVCAACPALALAQGGAPRAFLVGRAGQQLQAAVQHATHRSTRARHPTRSAVVPTRGGRCAASLGCPRLPRRRHSAAPGMAVEVDQLIEHVRRAREPRHDRRVPTPHARLRLARLGLGGRQQLPSPAAAVLARSPTDDAAF
jgi:hypothetical protein